LRKDYFDHPAPGQQNEAALGLGQPDDFEADAVLGRRRRGGLSGVALVDEGHLDGLGSDVLDGPGEFGDLGTIGLPRIVWTLGWG
jgi:hypothetical protein